MTSSESISAPPPAATTAQLVENFFRHETGRLHGVLVRLFGPQHLALALKVLCGFSTGEIARAFLTTEAAIAKQLTRTKQRIERAGIGFEIPEGEDLTPRLNGVLAALYLLFNEGYKASAGDRLLRE